VGLLGVQKFGYSFPRWRFDYSSSPTGGEFDFSKSQIPTLPEREVVGIILIGALWHRLWGLEIPMQTT